MQDDPFARGPAGQEARDSKVGPAIAVATRAKAAKMVKACMIVGFAYLAFVVGLVFEFYTVVSNLQKEWVIGLLL